MLRLKLCFIDASELHYIPNNLYNKPLPSAQRNALYLATALSARQHQITFIQEGCLQASQHENLSIEPFPEQDDYWQIQAFDAIILINHLAPGLNLAPHKPPTTALLLWSFHSPKHLSLKPLESKALQAPFDLVMLSNAVLAQEFKELYGTGCDCTYFLVAMTRTLRKRFSNLKSFMDVLPKSLTLSFIQRPEQGLEETLYIFETLSQGFENLQLQVLLPAEERPWSKAEAALIQQCEDLDNVTVFSPMPQPAYVEQLARSHVLCSPRAHLDPTHYGILDSLATGNHSVALRCLTLESLGSELTTWVENDPEDTQLVRYTEALAKCLQAWLESPEAMIKQSFDHIATIGTYFTWDLRVWEFESMLFQLKKILPKSSTDAAPVLK
jgi:hypothetical protein